MGGIILNYLDHWYEQPLGAAFAQAQQAEIEMLLPKLKGQRLLQLGFNPGVNLESKSLIPYHISLAPDMGCKQSDPFVAGSYHALPFLSESIDVVLINQVLEFESDLHLVLDEVWRILTGEGQVMIMGFHALSLWGLIRCFKNKQAPTPWRGHFHSLFEVKRALTKLNFNILNSKTFFFRPPIQNDYLLSCLEILEKCGSALWPIFGAGYWVVAQKKILATPPLRSRWQFSELVTDRAIKAATRV